MRKIYFGLFALFMIIVSVSACSAVDDNLTEDLNTQISDNEQVLIENNINEDIGYNQNEDELLDNQVDNNYLKANDSSETYSFDDLNGWTSTGSVSLSDDGYDGSCVVLNQASISRDIDWSYVDKIGFWYKIPTKAGTLKVTVGDDTLLSKTASTAITSWIYFEQNVSYTGNQTLKLQGVGNNRASYIDSLVLTLKPKNQTCSFDVLDGWTSTGSVSLSDGGYDGSCVVLNQASISRDIDWSYVDKIGFWYKIPTKAGVLKVTVGDDALLSMTAKNAITSWIYFEQNVSYTGNQTLKFQGVGNNRASYIDSLVLFFNYNKSPVKELIGTKFSSVLNDDMVIITLMDLDDNPISDVNINYTINNGNMLNNITNSEGQIVVSDVLTDVVIFANFTGNDDYLASNITVKILSTKLSINSTESSVVISLKDSEDNSISGVKIDYSINNNDLMSTITNNQGQVIVRNVIGNVTIFASYSGNDKKYLKTNGTENCYVNHFEGNPFTNPYFDEGMDESGNIYGWNITYGAAHGGSGIGGGVITGNDRNLMFSSNYYGYTISQYLNFDCIDKIFFKYFATTGGLGTYGKYDDLTIVIDGTSVESSHISRDDGWQEVIIDVTNFNGYNLFKLSMSQLSGTDGTPYSIYFDDFTVEFNNKIISNFNYDYSLEDNNISVKFTNEAIGNFNNIIWNFGDGTTSTEVNPSKIFQTGEYNVTLTVSNENSTATYSQLLSLIFPTINGQMYVTMQEAINNATDGDVIDVPADLSENININKNLTLNFNSNKLINNGSSPVIQVTGGAQVTIKNITFEDYNVISTDDESSLIITESNIADTNITLNTGNIALDGNDFTSSYITVVNANAVIANNNIDNGGIKVNGGKSKINNNVLSGNDVAITQTEGETNITSNVITDNNIGVNVTNGTANINFNVIYSNTNVSLAYVGSVDASNNWFGVMMPSFSTTPSDEYVDIYAPNAEQPAWLILTLNSKEIQLYTTQNHTIIANLTTNSNGNDTSSLGVLPKFTLPVSTEVGEASDINVEDSMGEFTLTTGKFPSDEVSFTIRGEEYTLDDVAIVAKIINTNLIIESVENGVVIVTLKDIDGNTISDANVTYTVNSGNQITDKTVDGKITIAGLKGTVTIAADYVGSSEYPYYNSTTASETFHFVYDGNINITIPESAKTTETPSITIQLPTDAQGTVNIFVDTKKINTTQVTGTTIISLDDVGIGEHVVEVTYDNDDIYYPANKTQVLIVSKGTPTITATGCAVGENETATVEVNIDGATGIVLVEVGGNKYFAELENGNAIVNVVGLKHGNYTADIKYIGDEKFTGTTATVDIKVSEVEDKTITELKAELAEAKENATQLLNNLTDANNKIENLTTQLNETQANATKLAEDLADANAKVDGLTNQLNETQANATKLADELKDTNQKAENLTTQLGDAQKQIQTLSADLISTTVAANNLNIKALTNGNIQVTLKANGTALANKTVNAIINGVVYNGTTDDNGVAKIAVKFSSAGTYYATVTFAGDDTYKSSISTSKVVVSKKATKITAPKKSFKAKVKTKKVKITLKSVSAVLKSKKITLKVNGKTYAAKTNSKGVATIKVTKLTKKGTFTYTVKFAGDKSYKAITKKGKMTIK